MSNNTLCWADIPVANLDRAISFYTAVLGLPVSKVTFPAGSMGLLPHAEENASGCLVVMEDNQPSLNGPTIYLSVEGRLDLAAQAVIENGGRILQEKHSLGPHGCRVVIVDSEGNRLALHSQTA